MDRNQKPDRNTETKTTPGCKVIFFHRDGDTIRFAVIASADGVHLPELAFPLGMDIEEGLRTRAREAYGLFAPRVEHRFVARPAKDGWLYYLVQETQAAVSNREPLRWETLSPLLPQLPQEDRKALVRAVQYLQDT